MRRVFCLAQPPFCETFVRPKTQVLAELSFWALIMSQEWGLCDTCWLRPARRQKPNRFPSSINSSGKLPFGFFGALIWYLSPLNPPAGGKPIAKFKQRGRSKELLPLQGCSFAPLIYFLTYPQTSQKRKWN